MKDFDGLVAIVTGGASGIGLATALELAERGARVVALDIRLDGLPDHIDGELADVSDRVSVERAVGVVAERQAGIDIVINNAGVGATGTVADNDDAEWARVLDINVVGMARVSAAALPWLRMSESAAIVNTCSVAALNGLPQRALYSASKGAVLSLTLAMATDHLVDGIRVNAVCPGTASTPWVDRLLSNAEDPDAERAALEARQPMGRLVSPEEIAHAICYLASPLSASTTGTILDVDGGLSNLRVRPVAK
jgi:NAD(P)-dependent dehydrogenase (short-subunit alcohol dehydrogenase family)